MSDPSLAVAVRAARNAAAVMGDAAHDLKRLPAFSKEHGEIASTADAEAGNAIVTTLLAAFPDHAVIGEERGAAAEAIRIRLGAGLSIRSTAPRILCTAIPI